MSFVQEHTNDDVHDYRDVGGRATQEQLPRMYCMTRLYVAKNNIIGIQTTNIYGYLHSKAIFL